MRNDYTIYIIVCFLSILFSLINRVYPIGGKEYLLNNVMYFSTWGTLFFIEIRKVLIIKGNKKEQSVDSLFSGYVKVRFLEMCLVGYRRLVANLNCLTSNYMSYAWE